MSDSPRYRVALQRNGASVVDTGDNPSGRVTLCHCLYNGDAELICDALNGVTIPQAVVAKTISVLKQYRDEAFIQEERWDDLLQDLIAKLQQAIGGGNE